MEMAAAVPNDMALILPSHSVSYRDLNLLTWRAAQFFHNNGVRSGDVILLRFNDSFLNVLACLGLLRIGATLVPISNSATPSQIRSLEGITAPSLLVSDQAQSAQMRVPSIVVTYREVILSTPVRSVILIEEPEGFAIYAHGSGSSGNQKVIPQSHQQLYFRCQTAFGKAGLPGGSRILSLATLEYVAGINRLLSAIHHGAAIAFFNGAMRFPNFLKEKQISILFSTVFHVELLLSRAPEQSDCSLSYLDSIRLSGSVVSDGLRARVRKNLNENLQIVYGANESGRLTLATTPQVYEIGATVGKALQGVNIEVVDENDGPVAGNSLGHIRVRSNSMITEYLNDPIATEQAFRSGWFYTGDLGLLTTDGELILRGRADDMMIFNGVNIFPAELEQLLQRHPSVSDLVVFPLKHSAHQDVPVCAYTVHPDCTLTSSQFHSYGKELLGSRSPNKFVLLKSMPRNGSGKILRRTLLEMLKQGL
jgi:cyanophycin synthetase